MYTPVRQCRICRNTTLSLVLDLGEQVLTGVFPRDRTARITKGPLQLVKCTGGNDACGLLQLAHSYDLGEMYGENYGYRSGLNTSMVRHLHAKVARIRQRVELRAGELVVDIGSNDSTTLQAYPADLTLVGIDPTGVKFHSYYPPHVQLIPDFFSSRLLKERLPGRKAKVITSFSMFYDLEDPIGFMQEVHQVLADDGIWVFEQSYMPTMLETNSYDTVCHEHLEYYGLAQVKWIADRVGFRIVDVELNDINGGSFSVVVRKTGNDTKPPAAVQQMLDDEKKMGLDALEPYLAFARRAADSRAKLLEFLHDARARGKTVAALGASTKGNTILQWCGIDNRVVDCAAERNEDKFGARTIGTEIPIVSEAESRAMKPDYYLVLPWHFREEFLEREKALLDAGVGMIFPLPEISIIKRS